MKENIRGIWEGAEAVPRTSLVYCPECGLALAPDDLDHHVRTVHHLHHYNGTCAPLPEILSLLIRDLCCPNPVPQAARQLERILRQEYGRQAPEYQATLLREALGRVDPTQLPDLCDALARLMARRAVAQATTAYLAAEAVPAGRQLALALTVHMPPPLERRLVRLLRPLLEIGKLPEVVQIAAAAALLGSTGLEGGRALSVLKALVVGCPRLKALDRLRLLSVQVPTSPALKDYLRHLEGGQRLRCPRCQVRFPRSEMVQHLWSVHGLVLDGETVREPWTMIEEWLTKAAAHPSEPLLERCLTFGHRLDPLNGRRRVQRLALARGLADEEARRTHLAEAARLGASVCPHCYEWVPIPQEEPTRRMSVSRGRLSSLGYRVEVSEHGWFPWAEIEMPGGNRVRSPLPERRLTRRGALLVLAGPLTLLALILSFLDLGPSLLLYVVIVLLLTAATSVGVWFGWRPRTPLDHRAIDHAWTELAPRLHTEGFSLDDSAFVASLALASLCRGRPELRQAALERLLPLTTRLVSAGFGGARHLAALRRLAIADAVRQGKDRVLLLVAEVDTCFHGSLPLAFADGLLEGWEEEGWTREERARLRVLLLESAFEASFEVRDILEGGATAPALAVLVDAADREGLAQLRLLWSLRASRPWHREGTAITAFELAATAATGEILGRYPDLLIRHALPSRFATEEDRSGQIILCGRGVVFRDTVLTAVPRTIEIARRKGAFELTVDRHIFRFSSDPEVVAERIERWCRYYFQEFQPRVAEVLDWQSPDATAVLRAWGTVRCPDCHHPLLPRLGEAGIAIDEDKATSSPLG